MIANTMTVEDYKTCHKSKKCNKYGNVKAGGYDSLREQKRATELKLMERLGIISELKEQVPFVLIKKSEHGRAIKYVADFTYMTDGKLVVEDTKGYTKNPVYRLKKRMMAEIHGIRVIET